MKRFLVVTLLFAAAMVAIAGTASATVVDMARWRGGEDDVNPGPTGTFGGADSIAVDQLGHYNLTHSGDGSYYAYPADYPTLGGLPAWPGPSTVDYAFAPGSGAYSGATAVPMGTQNWGMQVSVQCNDTANELVFLQNGSGGTGAALFSIEGSLLGWASGVRYAAEIAGTGVVLDSGVPVDTAWHNLALVNDGGTNTLYVDGTATSSYTMDSLAPAGDGVFLGQRSDALMRMVGGLDQARIFTFAPGAFQVSDLHGTPEPSTMVLLTTGLIGLLTYAWRNRK